MIVKQIDNMISYLHTKLYKNYKINITEVKKKKYRIMLDIDSIDKHVIDVLNRALSNYNGSGYDILISDYNTFYIYVY